ncbi:MAG: hypothetical protein ABIP94_08870 [Planctomycetota bacterium]
MHHVEIDLHAGVDLHGKVVDAAAATPIVDAEVSDSWTFKRIARTGFDGRFTLSGLKDSNFAPVYVRAAGYAPASRNLAGRLRDEVELPLVRGGEVVGRCVTTNGKPVATA